MGAADKKHCEAGFHRWVRGMQVIRHKNHVIRTCQTCLKQEVVLVLSHHGPHVWSKTRDVLPYGS
jgi:hypothetical protein